MLFLMKRVLFCKVEQIYSFTTLGKVRSVSTVKREGCFQKPSTPVAKMENIFTQIPELKRSHIHIRDIKQVEQKIKDLSQGNHEKLQVITDFDYTLTKSHLNGTRCTTCHGVIENYSRLPASFREKQKQMFEKFYPIEIDPHLTVEEKLPHMLEWYDEGHELMLQCDLVKQDFALMVQENPTEFREGTSALLSDLNQQNIPVLVFSAGVGDVIDEALKISGLMKDNVKVISNYMEFDENDKLIRFSSQLIHMFNKNESAVRNASYFQELSHRNNVILMGDSLGDLQMAHGVEPPSTVLKIGFLNDKIEERLEKYKDGYDIVLVNDQTMDLPHAVIKMILSSA